MNEKWVKTINVQKLGHSFDISVNEDATVSCIIAGKTIVAAELRDGLVKFAEKQQIIECGMPIMIGGLSIRTEEYKMLEEAQQNQRNLLTATQQEKPAQVRDELLVAEAIVEEAEKEQSHPSGKEGIATESEGKPSQDSGESTKTKEVNAAGEMLHIEEKGQEEIPQDKPEEQNSSESVAAELDPATVPVADEVAGIAKGAEQEYWRKIWEQRKADLKKIDSWKRRIHAFRDAEKKGQKYCVHTIRIGNNKYRFVERKISGKIVVNPDYKILDEMPRVGGVPKQYGELLFWDYLFEDKGWQRVRVLTHNEEICLDLILKYGYFAIPKDKEKELRRKNSILKNLKKKNQTSKK